MKLVYEFTDGGYPVQLHQGDDAVLQVTYGHEVSHFTCPVEAGEELGHCIMHSLVCAGKIMYDPDEVIE